MSIEPPYAGITNPLKQFVLTVSAGKRLIARGLAAHPAIRQALSSRIIVIVAGTTNAYVAEELLTLVGGEGFDRRRFFRGVTLPPQYATTAAGRLPDESTFPGDVILRHGVWEKGRTIFDVIDELQAGDIILKGANAVDLKRKRAAILVAHPRAGTIGAAIPVVIGRRVQLVLPVGLEKRVADDLDDLARYVNAPETEGPRLFPVPGLVFTEIEALNLLTGADARLIAAGGIGGAEGSIRLAVSGTPEQLAQVTDLLQSLAAEPPFEL